MTKNKKADQTLEIDETKQCVVLSILKNFLIEIDETQKKKIDLIKNRL